MVWLSSMVIEPFAFGDAASTCTVVDGSISRVEPSKKVMSACPESSVRTRSLSARTAPSLATTKSA